MSILSGGRPAPPHAGLTQKPERADKGKKRPKRGPKSIAIESLREQIASCEARIAGARDAETTVKALRVALAALESK